MISINVINVGRVLIAITGILYVRPTLLTEPGQCVIVMNDLEKTTFYVNSSLDDIIDLLN